MQDILKQLQEAIENFDNLFEVDGDGLGNPAEDVPPSTNKIKKDIKTKNGKVELVSVEDELFPKEGNAKEQFKQKVLDKINAMIQGTGTLEDLLNVVRAKQVKPVKEGFEGALEILEQLLAEGRKEGESLEDFKKRLAQEQGDKHFNNYINALEKVIYSNKHDKKHGQEDSERSQKLEKEVQKHYSNFDKAKNAYLNVAGIKSEKKFKKDIKDRIDQDYEDLKAEMRANSKNESFECAIEILEQIINEVSIETFKAARKEHNKRLNDLYDKQNARTGEIFKKHGVEGNTYSAKTPEDVKKAVETEKDIKSDKELADINKAIEKRSAKSSLYANQFRKQREKKDYLGEAQELLEEIINEVSDKTAQGALDKAKERYNRKGYEASLKLFKGDSKGAIEDGNKAQDEYNKHINMQLRRAKRQGKKLAQDKNDHDSFKIEEAQQLLEEIINEVSVGKLAKAAENSFPKRQEEHKKSTEGLKKAHDSYEEQSKKHPEDEQALYNSLDKLSRATHKAGEKASHANDIVNLNLPKDSKVSANKLFDKADKTYAKRGKEVDKALEKGKGRGDKEFDAPMKKFSRAVDLAVADPVVARRTNGGTNESFAESIKILEAILSETKSPEEVKEVAKKVLPNRKSEYLSKYANVLDGADIYGSENVPDGDIKDLDRAEKRYKHAKEKASLKESSYTEDTINKVAKKVLPQREADAKKAHDSLNHAMSINPHSMLNGKLSQRQKEVISNALNNAEKADNKLAHAKGILNKSKKEDSTGIKFDKILCALECLIDEATVGKLSNAVDNSVIKRQKEAEEAYNKVKTSKGADQVLLKAKADKAKKRLQHAQDLKMLRLPKKSGVSANKLFKSAEKSLSNRENNTIKNGKSGSYEKYKRAWNITDANPLKETLDMLEKLKEQINKNYEEEFKNEGLFVNDGRGDLIDDISKCLTKKTVKQHVVDTAKKLMKPRKVKAANEGFDSSEEKGYNEDKVLKLLEDIINEVSTKFTEPRIASVHGKVEKLEKQEEQEKDPVVKDKLNKERIQLQHKLNVVTDHVSNYHANQIKRDEAERNKRKNKKKE